MFDNNVKEQKVCRTCGKGGLRPFLDLGKQPPANALLDSANEEENVYPLALCHCPHCELIQLTYVVNPEILFKKYFYFSSVSKVMINHFSEYAKDVVKRFVEPSGLVVELGSNDGILLSAIKDEPIRILGVDPAENVSAQARENGIPTMTAFFCEDTAKKIFEKEGAASAIIANNVFAHIDDLDSVVKGVDLLLDKNGVFIIEAPYIVDFLKNLEFDTVYHEHLSYLGVKPLQALFSRFGFEIFDIVHQPVHGGSVRYFVQRSDASPYPVAESVSEKLQLEKNAGTSSLEQLRNFAERVATLKTQLVNLITKLKSEGKTIVGYGAPAKGNVLLNYCGLAADKIDYIVDSTPAKQGHFAPGVKIPIYPPEKLRGEQPDFALLLAWNHQAEIVGKEQAYRDAGGKFIIPIPEIKII
jgi:D-mycarose 3-C-methyltransferase